MILSAKIKRCLLEEGNQPSTAWSNQAHSESGMMSWATLIAVFLFTCLIAVVFNVGQISNEKMQAQNAADSAAYSASLVQARGLNAITASNHMIGELLTLYTMHHGIGGKVLDDRDTKNSPPVFAMNMALNVGYPIVWGVWRATSLIEPRISSMEPVNSSDVNDVPRGEATVHDAKCVLKFKMLAAYIEHAEICRNIAILVPVQWFPPAAAALAEEIARLGTVKLEMEKFAFEYELLTRLEQMALDTLSIKQSVIPTMMKGLWKYEQVLAGGDNLAADLLGLTVRSQALEAAKWTGTKNQCVAEAIGRPNFINIVGSTLTNIVNIPSIPSTMLAVNSDPTTVGDGAFDDDHSQLMRAMYPWLQEWRSPVLLLFGGIPGTPLGLLAESRAHRFYEYYTDKYAKEKAKEFRERDGIRLLVLEETNASQQATDKGTESWRKRENSQRADELFALIGVARHRKPPANSHIAFFPRTNPTPVAAVAQAIHYNSSRPRTWERSGPDYFSWRLGRRAQPVEGWDTLNWTQNATEYKVGKPYFEWIPEDFKWCCEVIGTVVEFFSIRIPFLDVADLAMDAAFPPDIRIPFTDIGVPEPGVQLHWKAKLVPIAKRNLAYRAIMISDEQLRKRIAETAIAAGIAKKASLEVLHQ